MAEYPTTFQELRAYLTRNPGPGNKPMIPVVPMSDAEWERRYDPEAVEHREMLQAIRENTAAIHRLADLQEGIADATKSLPQPGKPRPASPEGNSGTKL